MADEKQNNQETNQNQQPEPSQEELAAQWEQAIQEQEGEKEEISQEDVAKEWEQALQEQKPEEKQPTQDVMEDWSKALEEEETAKGENICPELEKMELLADIPVEISVEIGNTDMQLEEILNLHPNSIIELDRHINEPVDIKINGKLVAKGELYIVEDQYGIKITQIVTPEERLKLIDY